MRNRIFQISFLILLFVGKQLNVYSQTTKTVIKNADLNNFIAELKSEPALKHASWGFYVWNIDKSNVLCEYNSELALIPASTLKIVTTATALGLFGEDYKFISKLVYTGNIDSIGNLNGDIIFIGSGDPTLASGRINTDENIENLLNLCYKSIVKSGIKKINGCIIADASVFDDFNISPQWLWCDMGNYYGAGASGININENYFKIKFKPGNKIGDTATVIGIEPKISEICFENQVTTASAGSGDNVVVYGSPFSNFRMLTGTVPVNKSEFSIKASIPDPAFFFASSLHNYLIDSGLIIENKPITQRDFKNYKSKKIDSVNTNILAQFVSPQLTSIIYHTNIKSINSYAESLLRLCGTTTKNKGSLIDGIDAIYNYWLSNGIDLEGFNMKDGSGLSPVNRITPRQLAEILAKIYKLPYYKSFENSLPVAGKSGSIASLFKGTAAEGNLKAKSGYLTNVRAYAGYVTNKSKQNLSFAILVNNYDGSKSSLKSKLENLMVKLAESE